MSKVPLIAALALAFALPARSQAPRSAPLDITGGDLLNPVALDDQAAPKKAPAPAQTEITANGAEFNNKTRIAVFAGEVIVKNPEFNVKCDKLTAYLKGENKVGSGDKPAADKPGAPGDKPRAKGGGLEKAIAEMTNGGKVIITQEKKEADGSTTNSIGKADKAHYNAITGEVTLIGWPEMRQGINTGVAQEESAEIIMTRDGKMRTEGRVKFLIQDSATEKAPAKP